MSDEPLREGYSAITPMVIVVGADDFHEFIGAAFGAEPRGPVFRMPDGRIAHSEATIGDAVLMVADATDEFPANSCGLHLYVADIDAVFAAAVAAGATVKSPPEDQFYGDRSAVVVDPFGNSWSMAQHLEDVSDDEMSRRISEMFGS